MPNTDSIRFCLFGHQTAGKTTLLTSFFGDQSDVEFSKSNNYRLRMKKNDDTAVFLERYHILKNRKTIEKTSEFRDYDFSLNVPKLDQDPLSITVYDYPGEWLQGTWNDPSGNMVENNSVLDAFSSCHAALFVFCGERIVNEGDEYIRFSLALYTENIERMYNIAKYMQRPFTPPKNVIFAVTKCDLLPEEYSVDHLKSSILDAGSMFSSLIRFLSLGHNIWKEDNSGEIKDKKTDDVDLFQYSFLLTSAYGYDAGRRSSSNGVNLILPIIVIAAIKSIEFELNNMKNKISKFEWFLSRIMLPFFSFVDKLDDFLPRKWQIVTAVVKIVQKPLEEIISESEEDRKKALEEGNSLKFVISSMLQQICLAKSNKVLKMIPED